MTFASYNKFNKGFIQKVQPYNDAQPAVGTVGFSDPAFPYGSANHSSPVYFENIFCLSDIPKGLRPLWLGAVVE
jgi:hypothetical protein